MPVPVLVKVQFLSRPGTESRNTIAFSLINATISHTMRITLFYEQELIIFEKPKGNNVPVQLKTTKGKCLGIVPIRHPGKPQVAKFPSLELLPSCKTGGM